jgi:hypothetical protein
MRQSRDRSIDATMEGTITGQVAVGENIVQTGDVHGDVVLRVALADLPVPQPRRSPVVMRPRPLPGLLDREEELLRAGEALQAEQPIGVCGEGGLGKSALLQRIAHLPEADEFPDGVILLPARHVPEGDLRQVLFTAFYECKLPIKPTEAQIQQALGEKRALVLLDDVGLSREEAETLMSVAPHCTFVVSSEEGLRRGEGCDLPLRGLPLDAAMALVGRELGRPLAPDEAPQARAICEALDGHPRRIMQAVAAVREGQRSFAALAVAVRTPAPAQALAASLAATLTESQRQVLGALAALDGAATGTGHIAAISGTERAAADLEALERLNLVKERELQYRLTGVVPAAPEAAWVRKALAHFASWGERLARSPRAILGESAAMGALIARGAAMGQWAEVLRLARVVEGPLTLAGRWQAWQSVLQHGLSAARALGDQAAEAWLLHQEGVRALALGDTGQAQEALGRALEIREAIGDQAGAAATERILDIATGATAPPVVEPADTELVTPVSAKAVALKLLSVLLVLGIGGFLAIRALSPPKIADLQVRPEVVDGGGFTALTVTLNKEAPKGGAEVTLASSESAVQVPIRVTVPAGSRKRAVLISTSPVAASTRVTITAAHESSLQAVGLEVRPVGRPVEVRLTLAPRAVTGGRPVAGRIELGEPAPREGLAVVQSGEEGVVRAPTSVTIPAGAEQVRFTLETRAVTAVTAVTVTVSYAGVSRSAALRVAPGPAQLAGIAFERPSVTAGLRVVGTVTLSGPAPAGGAAVALSASNSAVAVAPAVTVPEGKTSARFQATAAAVKEQRTVQVTASFGSRSRRTALVVEPPGPALAEVVITPAEVNGGEPAEGVVRLAQEAGRDITVLLSSNSSTVTAPEAVTIGRGQRQAGFAVKTAPSPRLVVATLTARYDSYAESAQLRVLPTGVLLASIGLDRTRVAGGETVTGTVSLSGPAPEAVVVGLGTNQAAARVPSRVTVPAGEDGVQFPVRTAEVEGPVSVQVTATLSGVSKRASLTIGPVVARVEALVARPEEVRSGAHVGVMVRLDRAAPEAVEVPLSCDRAEVMVPQIVRIGAGEREGTVAVPTREVRETVTATIRASYGGVTRSARVQVLGVAGGAQLVGLSLDPTTVPAGGSATGTVRLSGAAAGDVVIRLTASSAAVILPSQVTVPAGRDSAEFQVETDARRAGPRSVTIAAAQGAITRSALLTIERPAPAALTGFRLFSEVDRHGVQYLTATILLSGPAPAGGATVTLSSDEEGVAVPPVMVPAGQAQAALRFRAPRISGESRPIAITAEYGGATRKATVTVRSVE